MSNKKKSIVCSIHSEVMVGLSSLDLKSCVPSVLQNLIIHHLYSCTADLTSPLDWPWKTTPIWPLKCAIPWCRSQFTAILPFCQLICTAAQLIWPHHWIDLEKLPQFDLWLSKSVQWIKRYSDNDFEVSWFVQSQVI